VVKGREKHLVEMVASFMDQYNKENQIIKATLTTAVPVEEKTVEELRKLLLSNEDTKGVEMQTKVDPEIVGGFVLQYGDMLLDHSVERKLQLIKKQIQDNTYISKI
jgi:F-type H+-transporting ATPase subunit delta